MAYLDILVIALIAILIALRLRAVLGERHGEERQRHDKRFTDADVTENASPTKPRKSNKVSAGDNIVVLKAKKREAEAEADSEPHEGMPDLKTLCLPDKPEVVVDVQRLMTTYPTFYPHYFLKGAESVFDIILTSYADLDDKALQPLLSAAMLKNFAKGIAQHKESHHKLGFSLVQVQGLIAHVEVKAKVVRLAVLFSSQQVNVIYDKNGAVLDGDPKTTEYCEDTWVFERTMTSKDPTWYVVDVR